MINTVTLRSISRLVCAAAMAGSCAATASAQTLSFTFVGPTASMVSNFGAANVKGGYADGYRGVAITAANVATFQKVAPEMLRRTYASLQPGTPLRTRIDRVMAISHQQVKEVEVRLVDDLGGLSGTANFGTSFRSKVKYVWPAAWNFPIEPKQGHKGVIGIGEFFAVDHVNDMTVGWTGWESVLLHEMLHTQFVLEKTKWGSVSVTYGLDGVHYFSEILGAQDLAFEEGLGTFYGYTHFQPNGMNATNAFFSRADERYIVEDGSIPASWEDLRKVVHRREERKIPEEVRAAQPDRGSYNRYYFLWNQVPGKYLLFNEWTSVAFHMYFWQNANNSPDEALRMIDEMSGWMWGELRRRNLAYGVNSLAWQLEELAATPQGKTKASAGTLTSSMFPFALLDVLTHFGMPDDVYQSEFTRNNLGQPSQALKEYWNHRAAVRKLVEGDLKASPVRIQQAVASIHKYFQQPSTIIAKP